MNATKTIYQFAIKSDGKTTYITEKDINKNKTEKFPLVRIYDDAIKEPIITASLLRDLAKICIERAEIIEELEIGVPHPEREFMGNYKAVLVQELV